MNWLDPPVEPPNVAPPQDPEAPSESNLNYWAARLLPLHDPTPTYSSPKPDADVEVDGNGREVVFVGCNRVGTEEGEIHQGLRLSCCVGADGQDRPLSARVV